MILVFVHVLAGTLVGAELLARYLDEKLTEYFKEKDYGRKQTKEVTSSRPRNKKSKARDI